MSEKLSIPIESLRLNLLESHREHCPWKNPVTQGNPPNGPIENMAGWQTQEFMLMGKKKEIRPVNALMAEDSRDSLDLGRGSMESALSLADKEKDTGDSLNDKWKKFKAKLRRTTSRKSLRSTKSIKSVRSVKSVNGDKENEEASK